MVAKPKPVKKVKTKKFIRRQSNSLRATLERKADSTVRDIVLLRDGCCVCPSPKSGHSSVRQAGHLIKRGRHAIKWDLYNVSEQCSKCNGRHNRFPEYYEDWFCAKFGGEQYARLLKQGFEVYDITIEDLELLIENLKEIHSLQLVDKFFKPRFSQKQILTGEWRSLRGIQVTSYKLDSFSNAVNTEAA